VAHAHQDVPPLPVVAPRGPAARFAERALALWDDDIAVRLAHRGGSVPALDVRAFDACWRPRVVWSSDDVVVSAAQVEHDPVLPSVAYRVDTPDGGVVISGDTRVCDSIAALSSGAGVLVHEVMLDAEMRRSPGNPVNGYHANAVELGAQARRLGVPRLVLTHLIPSFPLPEQMAAFADEVRAGGYEGEIVVGHDLAVVTLD
jgi:ribonuclease Z